MRILILGGTGEARELAAALVAAGADVVSSLAGRVSRPRLPDGPVRVGGFGGADGLAAFLGDEGITHVVDATHPFAATITANAATATSPSMVLRNADIRSSFLAKRDHFPRENDRNGCAAAGAATGRSRPHSRGKHRREAGHGRS